MFMMPMPSTKSEIEATAAKKRHDPAAAFRRFDELAQVAHFKILDFAGFDPVPAHQRFSHLADRRLDLIRALAM
jgi:hypothetical protein